MTSNQSPQSDAYHWQRLREGSIEALETLYDKFFPKLFRYGFQLVSNRPFVQDTLQDFFIELYRRRTTLSDVQQIRSYLYVCFRRKLLVQYRKQDYQVSDDASNHPSTTSQEHHLILQELEKAQVHLLKQSLAELTPRQKEAIFLRFYEELSYEEIAEVLGMKKTKYARTLIYRTITKLREDLSPHQTSLTLYSLLPIPITLGIMRY